ncbi:uncharacterized protein LOC125586332 [Brassica napus]|uniref:uncharacterized protein LOC125586332 n=1 Tax=Brassica napus TaxID=3708 RepID=UPI00207ABCBF|nr:uncharacterized protein LOC125586332 [Brassica napus]
MEMRHGALSTANESYVIIASVISSLSSCQINATHHHHQHHPCMVDINKQLLLSMINLVILCFNMS